MNQSHRALSRDWQSKVMHESARSGVLCGLVSAQLFLEARRPAPICTPAMTKPDDVERTVIKSVSGPGGTLHPGLLGEYADALPVFTHLNEFELLSVIGQGGFGIVYLAHDLTLDRRVAIKEYMPSALATRTQAMTVAVRSSRHTETFAAGLRSFINEARLLAQFDHPSLLKVHRFWEAHGTAYMVMPYYAGTTLGKLLPELGGPPTEAWFKALLAPLLDALAQMHAAHCYHRDIAPDNILMLPDGRPLLLDFGAARHVISDMSQAPTVILKTGYAPVEQYGEMPDMSQGAWTDLYALASVVQFAITGQTPPQAVARFIADKREPLARVAAGRYSDAFLRAIDRALAVLPKDRPQSVAEMRALLEAEPAGPPKWRTVTAMAPPSAATAPAGSPPSIERKSRVVMASALFATAAAGARRAGRRTIVMIGAGLALAAVLGGYAWLGVQRHDDLVDPTASSMQSTPAPTTAASAIVPPLSDRTAEAAAPMLTEPMVRAPASTPAPGAEAAARTPAPPAPRATHARAPDARPTPRIPNTKLRSERCEDIIQRVSLGEEPSAAEKTFLKQECGQ